MVKNQNTKDKKFISESQRLFSQCYKFHTEKIRKVPDTIFENLEHFNEEGYYLSFIDSKYYDEVLNESSEFNKKIIIQEFLMEEYSNIFYTVKQKLEENHELNSFTNNYLLENTLLMFPEMIKPTLNEQVFLEAITVDSQSDRYKELMEEGFLYGGAAAAGTIAAGGTPLLAAGIGIGTTLAIELFLPTRWTLVIDKMSINFVTSLTRLLVGTKSMLGSWMGVMKNSQKSIETFDNIDLNKDIVKIFNSIGTRHQFNQPGSSAQSLAVIMEKCIDNNKDLFNKNNFFTLNIKNTNIYRNILNSMFVNNGNKNNVNHQKYDQLLKYRKCVASSLADVYKFTMIANLKDQPQFERIANSMSHGFNSNPNQLLNFIDNGNEHAKDIKENLLDLIKLRMIFNDMIINFKQGSFDVDREAGQFFEQKLRQTDREIVEYLKSSKVQHDTVFEKKEYNKIPGKSDSPFNREYKPINNTLTKPVINDDIPGDTDNEPESNDSGKQTRLNFM
jgi:hypothetical protein